jgi:uncharacterized protein (DUF1778 family)
MALRKDDLYATYDQEGQSVKRPRITIDVSPELRKRIKAAALQNNLSISQYLVNILEEVVPEEKSTIAQMEEDQTLTPEYLEQIHRVRERIIKESKGQGFEDSAEAVRRMREERTKYLEDLQELQ